MNLTRPQVRALTEGMAELNRIQNKTRENEKDDKAKGEKKYNVNAEKPESILQLFSMPGVKLTEKAQEALNKIKE